MVLGAPRGFRFGDQTGTRPPRTSHTPVVGTLAPTLGLVHLSPAPSLLRRGPVHPRGPERLDPQLTLKAQDSHPWGVPPWVTGG